MNNATPKMISGVTIGTNIRPFDAVANLPRQRCSPMAIAIPSGVATSMHSHASSRVFSNAR